MRRHYRRNLCRNCRPKRREFNRVHPFLIVSDGGQFFVRIDVGITVPRKMFGGSKNSVSLQTADIGGSQLRDKFRGLPVGTHADDRIARVSVNIHHRREVEVHADSG